MKHVAVGEFKAQFSDLLREVMNGERVAIQYGRRKKTVALLVPPVTVKRKPRKLGVLEGKASFRILRGYKMSEEGLLAQ